MQALVYFSFAVYFGCYIFEGPVRYILNMLHADQLIFIRDVILIIPLLATTLPKQNTNKNIHPAFFLFAIIIFIHGLISYLNIHNPFVIGYCIKLLITVLAGAVLAQYIIKPPKEIVLVVGLLWAMTLVGVFFDKYFIEYPWAKLSTIIGDIQVEISRDWQISGADKRASGFMRSSINVAIIEPLLAFIVIFNLPKFWQKFLIMILTLMVLYWTTQKASILAFFFVCCALTIGYKRPMPLLKFAITMAIIMMIAFPVILPQFEMPNSHGVFSLGSFYMRIEEVWPAAWKWIDRNEIIPFGVGLGGVGGAMRFYAPNDVNYADNMYIFLYAYFGYFAFVYLAWIWCICMRIKPSKTNEATQSLAISAFIFFYGGAMTMLEDQMASLFFGAAVSWLASEYKQKRLEYNATK